MAMSGFTPRVPSNLRFQESRFSQRFGKATFKFNTTLLREAVLKKSGKNTRPKRKGKANRPRRYSGACTYFSSRLPSSMVVTHDKSRPQPHATKRSARRLGALGPTAGTPGNGR
jgi:hypothetical protein